MLEDDYSTNLTKLLATCQCELVIPSHFKEGLSKKGVFPTISDDRRRFVRYHFNSRAILEFGPTLPTIPREPTTAQIITRNISRGGVAFLHSEQLFPGERVTLWFPTSKHEYTVVRCTGQNDHCFEIAAHTDDDNFLPVPLAQLSN